MGGADDTCESQEQGNQDNECPTAPGDLRTPGCDQLVAPRRWALADTKGEQYFSDRFKDRRYRNCAVSWWASTVPAIRRNSRSPCRSPIPSSPYGLK